MSRKLGIAPSQDLRRFIELMGPARVIDQIDQAGLEAGLKQIIERVGVKQALASMPTDEVLAALDLSTLTPQQLQDLKRRLP